MVICSFGESYTGKSTLAEALRKRTDGRVYTGKDYLRLAKGEAAAREAFRSMPHDRHVHTGAADLDALLK